MKQNQTLVEEELTSTKKKLSKSEKNLKLAQKREQLNDSSLIEKQLTLKAKEVEVFQQDLQNQKNENQKLREKVRDLLKKCSQTTSERVPEHDFQTANNVEVQQLRDGQIQLNADLQHYKQVCSQMTQDHKSQLEQSQQSAFQQEQLIGDLRNQLNQFQQDNMRSQMNSQNQENAQIHNLNDQVFNLQNEN